MLMDRNLYFLTEKDLWIGLNTDAEFGFGNKYNKIKINANEFKNSKITCFKKVVRIRSQKNWNNFLIYKRLVDIVDIKFIFIIFILYFCKSIT